MLSRRRFLLQSGLLAGAAALGAGGAPAVAKRRPNILFCFADDWGRYAGCYREADRPTVNDCVATPHIDGTAQEGVLFENAFMGVPSCTPSRASVSTGSYFWRCGRAANLRIETWEGAADPGDALPGFGTLLADAGYHLGMTYKCFQRKWFPSKNYMGAGKDFCEYSQTATAAANPEAAKAALLEEVRANFRAFLADRAEGAPFCYIFGPHNCHRPWTRGSGKALWGIEPDDLEGRLPAFLPDVPVVREDFADYLGEVQAWDAAVGLLMEEVARLGELDDTLVVLSGDNGMPGMPRGKCNLYDFGVAAPLVVRWPKGVPHPGRRVADFTNLMDLAPTFLEAAGLKAPGSMDGRSLAPLLASERDGQVDPSRDAVFTGRERHVPAAREGALPYPSRAVRTKDWLYIRNFKPERWPLGVRGEMPAPGDEAADLSYGQTYRSFPDLDGGPTKHCFIVRREAAAVAPLFRLGFGRRPAEELYDLRADPDQVRNVADDPAHGEVKAALAARLERVMRETGDPRLSDAFDAPPYVEPDPPERLKDRI